MNGTLNSLVSVLVVDPRTLQRGQLATALRDAACDVTAVATPLEAIEYLGRNAARPSFVSVADTVPVSVGEELRAYLDAEHAELTVLRMVAS